MIRTLVSNENLNDKIIILKSDYKSLLLEENHIREKKMIDLILKKIHSDNIEFEKKYLLSIMSDSDSEDIDILSFNLWIKENIK